MTEYKTKIDEVKNILSRLYDEKEEFNSTYDNKMEEPELGRHR